MPDKMYRDMIYYTGQVGPIMDRFIMDLAVAGNTAYELIYKMKVTWLNIFEDLLHSPLTNRIEASLQQTCKDRREFEHTSLDGMLRVIRKVVGHAEY